MSICAEVQYVSTSIVRPANPNMIESIPRIDLTQWDLAFLPFEYIQIGLLFTNPDDYGQQQSKQEHIVMMINHLKTSLSRTLDKFFPLAGRLAITKHDEDDGTISVYINCDSSKGAEFIHATADITVADILDPTYVPEIVNMFFSLNGKTSYEGVSEPLLSIQVTELNDGVFIGCSMNHSVGDGTSFWHFFNSWSEISRGSSEHVSSFPPPILKRWFPGNVEFPIRLPFASLEGLTERNCFVSQVLPNRIFHFTKESIARLKAKANSEINGLSNISSLQALLAHIWISVTRVRCLDRNEETTYGIAIGNRSRLNPPLPETYFGSPVQLGKATAKVGELLEKGLGWAASLFNQVIMSHNDAAIRSSLEAWVTKPLFITVNSNTNSTSLVPKNMLITGSSPRFNIYTNDFGWGRPIAVRSGLSNKSQGKLTVFPGRDEGSMDIEACLSLETLNAMADDVEFMEAVTVLPPFQRV